MGKPANDRFQAPARPFGASAHGPVLGDWVRTTRTAQGISQRALADRSGLSRSYLCDIERGRGAKPSVATLDKLANALGASRADLLRVAGILETAGRLGDERERRFLSIFRDLGVGAQDAVERFARFLHAEEHRWVQPRLLDGEEDRAETAIPVPNGPTLFDRLAD
ncbi:MAG TPA: helix-turn-helix transcriptional regulator [Thermomicrobiales bacterium]|jgi:transcriptional regulator with XRE-family HTH domain